MSEVKPGDKIYVMEKWVMNRDYPEPTLTLGDTIEPYHDGWWAIAAEREGKIGDLVELHTIDEVIKLIRQFSGKVPIIAGRHPSIPKEIDFEGDVEKYCGLRSDIDKFKESGIIFTEGTLI